jgi:hypothetical protein
VFTTVNSILFSIGFALVLVGQYLDALVSVGVISFNMAISLIQEVLPGLLSRPSSKQELIRCISPTGSCHLER